MNLSGQALAEKLQGVYSGPATLQISGAAGLEEATSADVSFLKDSKNQKTPAYLNSQAGVILVPQGTEKNGRAIIEVKNPLGAFAVVLGMIEKERAPITNGIHPTAYIHPKAKLGTNVNVGAFCVVEEDAVVGDGTTLMAHVYVGHRSTVGQQTHLYPHVVLRENVHVGSRCIIHPGTVIGSDGFGFHFENGRHQKIPQIGTVIIEDDIEIGACTTIDRATTGRTIIHKGTKVDNLVQVAHNVEVGENSLLVAQAGIAGSSTLGKGVVLAGQVGVADHVKVADGTQVGAQSGIKDNTQPGAILFGSPAQPIQDTLKQILLIRRLPELFKDVKNLKEKMMDHG